MILCNLQEFRREIVKNDIFFQFFSFLKIIQSLELGRKIEKIR